MSGKNWEEYQKQAFCCSNTKKKQQKSIPTNYFTFKKRVESDFQLKEKFFYDDTLEKSFLYSVYLCFDVILIRQERREIMSQK